MFLDKLDMAANVEDLVLEFKLLNGLKDIEYYNIRYYNMDSELKVCSRCKSLKGQHHFGVNNRYRDGKMKICKECIKLEYRKSAIPIQLYKLESQIEEAFGEEDKIEKLRNKKGDFFDKYHKYLFNIMT